MGLAERRAIKDFRDNTFPKIKAALDAAAGFEVNLEIDWENLGQEGLAELDYHPLLERGYFKPLIEAFKAITIDDLGRDALRDGLKKVTIGYSRSSGEFSFKGGELKFDYDLHYANDDWLYRKTQLQQVLEKGL
ncbi:MAG: hypothetical protein SNJ67_05640 [Chloracidobacterium sp.]|uniref:Uncharacterized protein n=1 Tax=Chloracidobacterium validum TaxID=2821543 RepID=A0ABX8B8G1_9BACT|nr:hypothetical protein [Chloracidobacterium validum]QUW03237.1 hypothetical protein J8C06_02005 [Chloracidobacterium validum]